MSTHTHTHTHTILSLWSLGLSRRALCFLDLLCRTVGLWKLCLVMSSVALPRCACVAGKASALEGVAGSPRAAAASTAARARIASSGQTHEDAHVKPCKHMVRTERLLCRDNALCRMPYACGPACLSCSPVARAVTAGVPCCRCRHEFAGLSTRVVLTSSARRKPANKRFTIPLFRI